MAPQVASRLKTIGVLWVTVLACLAVSACGGKKKSGQRLNPPPPVAEPQPEAGQAEPEADPTKPEGAKGSQDPRPGSGGPPGASVNTNDPEGPVPIFADKRVGDEPPKVSVTIQDPVLPPPPASGASEAPAPQAPQPAPAADQSAGPSSVQGNHERDRRSQPWDDIYVDPEAVDSIGTGSQTIHTGADGQQLVFSGSSEDEIVPILRGRLDRVPDNRKREANFKLAQEVGFTTVEIDWARGRSVRPLTVTTLLERYGRRRHYALKGFLGKDFKGTFGNPRAWPFISGDIVCLDLNGGCRTMRLRFFDTANETGLAEASGGSSSARTAYVVVRDTTAALNTKGRDPGAYPDNREYARLMGIFTKTGRVPGALDTVNYLNFRTSETVNGSSTFVVTMRMRLSNGRGRMFGTQQLRWSGPLLRTDSSSFVNVRVSQEPTFWYAEGQQIPVNPDFDTISNTVKLSRLVFNNGRGTIGLAVTIRATKPWVPEESLNLTVTRKQNPIKVMGL